MNAIRSFIAIELPGSIQMKLDEIVGRIKEHQTSAVRWVPAHNIHLTVKFLGDVSPANMEILMKMLKVEISQLHAFTISIGDLGAFPSPRRPRVIWVGVNAPPQLGILARLVDGETRKLGYAAEERPFSPHLTLGRVSQNASPEQVRRVADALAATSVGLVGTTEVREVTLFKSVLKPSGAEYTPLLQVPLLY